MKVSAGHAILVAATLVLGACSSREPAVESAQEPTRVFLTAITSLDLLDDIEPLIHARIPGVGDITLLIDTGAEFSWIDDAFARRVGLPRGALGATLRDIQGLESQIAERCFVDELEIGEAIVTNFKPPLFDTLTEHVDGALGQDILSVLDVVVDGPAKRLILIPRGTWDQAVRTLMEPGNVAYGYALDADVSIPTIQVAVGELEGAQAFEIDTGSAPMTFAPALAAQLGLEPTEIAPSWGLSHVAVDVPFYDVQGLALEALNVSGVAHEAPESRLGWGVLQNLVSVFPAGGKKALLFIDPTWRAAWVPTAR